MTAAASTCQSQSVCVCSGMFTLPRTTTVSGGQISTDCSYTVMPTEVACPANTRPTTVASSTVAASTAPAAVTSMPPPPPTMGAVVCAPWLTSYKGCHKDMDVKKLNETAEWLVQNQIGGQTLMTSKTPNYTEVYNAASGVSYIANVGWIPGCTDYASQNPTYPSGDTNDENWTYNIIYWNWLNCKYSILSLLLVHNSHDPTLKKKGRKLTDEPLSSRKRQ